MHYNVGLHLRIDFIVFLGFVVICVFFSFVASHETDLKTEMDKALYMFCFAVRGQKRKTKAIRCVSKVNDFNQIKESYKV